MWRNQPKKSDAPFSPWKSRTCHALLLPWKSNTTGAETDRANPQTPPAVSTARPSLRQAGCLAAMVPGEHHVVLHARRRALDEELGPIFGLDKPQETWKRSESDRRSTRKVLKWVKSIWPGELKLGPSISLKDKFVLGPR